MEMICKKAGIESLNELVELRIEFIKDIHPDLSNDLLHKMHRSILAYFTDLITNNAYIGFLGLINENLIVCSAGLLLYYLPPLNSGEYRKIGHVLNFFTRPQYRRKGFGLKLMEYIKATAKIEGINRLVLNSTQMGYPLYKKAGFVEPEDIGMILEL